MGEPGDLPHHSPGLLSLIQSLSRRTTAFQPIALPKLRFSPSQRSWESRERNHALTPTCSWLLLTPRVTAGQVPPLLLCGSQVPARSSSFRVTSFRTTPHCSQMFNVVSPWDPSHCHQTHGHLPFSKQPFAPHPSALSHGDAHFPLTSSGSHVPLNPQHTAVWFLVPPPPC